MSPMTIDMTTCSKDRSIELRTMDISCEVVRKTNTSPADEERKEKTAFFLPKGARKIIVFLSLLFLSLSLLKLKHPDRRRITAERGGERVTRRQRRALSPSPAIAAAALPLPIASVGAAEKIKLNF